MPDVTTEVSASRGDVERQPTHQAMQKTDIVLTHMNPTCHDANYIMREARGLIADARQPSSPQ